MKKISVLLFLVYLTLNSFSQQILWGTTKTGGAYNNGVIYKIDVNSGVFEKVHDFDTSDVLNGGAPVSTLICDQSGKLYGTAIEGGSHKKGVIYSYDPANQLYEVIYHFNDTTGIPVFASWSPDLNYDITLINDSLLFGISSKIYYTQRYIYEFNINTGQLLKLYSIPSLIGYSILSGLTSDQNSMIYGTSTGHLYGYNYLNDSIKILIHFNGMAVNGLSKPFAASDGKIYGAMLYGGSYEVGSVYKYNPVTHLCWDILQFNPYDSGTLPYASLAETTEHDIIGATINKLYKFDVSDSLRVTLHSFGGTDGSDVYSAPVVNSSNLIFGTTTSGGTYNSGVVYKFDLSDSTFTKLFDFDSINGKTPGGSSLLLTGDVLNREEYESKQFDVGVYPVPANDRIFIECNENMNISVFNIIGELVLQKKLSKNDNEVDIRTLPKGIYILTLSGADNLTVQKKIIKV
jgi:uncharacterized repeat protein (TIGR03803 family)